jgi:hypothetical protein
MKDERSVAPDENIFQLHRIRLCRVVLDSLPEFNQGAAESKDKKTWFELAAERLKIEIVTNAYVILLRIDYCDTIMRESLEHGVFARTDGNGELVYICDLVDADDSALSRTSNDPMLFNYMEEVLCFWTQAREGFTNVLGKLQADTDQAVADFFELRTVQDGFTFSNRWNEDLRDDPFDLLEPLVGGPARLALIREVLVGYPAGKQYTGFFPAQVVDMWLHASDPMLPARDTSEYVGYWMVGSKAIYALYLAELLYYHTLSLPQRYASDFATFAQARDLVEKSRSGERDPSLDEATQTFYMGTYPFKYAWWLEYRNYAYSCARNGGVSRDLFRTAIDFNWATQSDGWWQAADDILRIEPKAIHPVDHTKPVNYPDMWHTIGEDAAMAIFDFYRFGLEYEENHWFDTIEETEEDLKRMTGEILAQVREYLGKYVTKSALIAQMGFWYPDDPDRRGELIHRYLTISDQTGYDWSTDAEHDLKYESMLKEFAEWFGTLLKKVTETIEHHYEKLETLQKLANNLANKEHEITLFIGRFADWEKRIGRYQDLQELPDQQFQKLKLTRQNIRKLIKGAEVKVPKITISAVTTSGEKTVFELQFLEDEVDDVALDRRLVQKVIKTRDVDLDKLLKLKKYEHHAHLEHVKLWPKCLVAAGQWIGLVVNSQKLIEEFKKDSNGEIGMALVKVGHDVFEVADGTPELLSALRHSPVAEELGTLVARKLVVKGGAAVLEVVINYHDGAQILFMDEDSPAVEAAAEGRQTIATLQKMKGVVLVTGTTIGVIAGGAAFVGAVGAGAGVGAAVGAALPPLGLALAITAAVVVVIDVGIYLLYGPANIMEELLKELHKANGREFGVQWVTETKPTKHRTIDEIERFQKRVPALLS